MELHIGCRAHLLRELRQIGCTTHLLELLAYLQTLGNGVEVNGLQLRRERLDCLVDEAVLLGVEGVGGDILLHSDDTVTLQHQGTQHSLLKLNGLGRYGTLHWGLL